MSLKELLGSGEKRKALIQDACTVLDQEVADKSGLSGAAIKTAFKLIKGIKSGFIPEVVDSLLDDFLDAVDPIYSEAKERDINPSAHLQANSDQAAEGLLAVTDRRAERADSGVVKKTYSRLRPTAKKHVMAAMPRLGQMLGRHAPIS